MDLKAWLFQIMEGSSKDDYCFCPKCGTENLDDAVNCKKCRINLEWAIEHIEEDNAIKQSYQETKQKKRKRRQVDGSKVMSPCF